MLKITYMKNISDERVNLLVSYSFWQTCRDVEKNMSCVVWRAFHSKNAETFLKKWSRKDTHYGDCEENEIY